MNTLLKSFPVVLMVTALCSISDASSKKEYRNSWITLNSVSFDTDKPLPGFPSHLVSEKVKPGTSSYYIVKFPGPITRHNYESLTKIATRIYTYLPNYAYLVKLRAETKESVPEMTGASWVGRFHPAYKLSRWISSVESSDSLDRHIVMVQVFPDARLDRVLTRLNRLGVKRDEAQNAWANLTPSLAMLSMLGVRGELP